MNPIPVSPRSIQNLEKLIVSEASTQCKTAFGDKKITIFDDNPLFKVVLDRLEYLTQNFPHTENNKVIVSSRCIVTPKLLVRFSVLKALIEETVKGNMLDVKVGKQIPFGPLLDPVLDYITTEDIELKVRNIRMIQDGKLVDNEITEEMVLQQAADERDCIILNEDVTYGHVDANPNIRKTQILADFEFGDFKGENQLIDVQTEGDEHTTYLIFKLPPIEGKISHSGSVTLIGKKFTKHLELAKLEELLGSLPPLCIDHTFNADAPFFPTAAPE